MPYVLNPDNRYEAVQWVGDLQAIRDFFYKMDLEHEPSVWDQAVTERLIAQVSTHDYITVDRYGWLVLEVATGTWSAVTRTQFEARYRDAGT